MKSDTDEKKGLLNEELDIDPKSQEMTLRKFFAELIGTFGLTFFACGTAVATSVNIPVTGLAFGVVLIAMAYSIGNVSGCHINPAVSLAMLIRKCMTPMEFAGYLLAQFLGGLIGSALLGLCLRGTFKSLASNSIQELIKNKQSEIDAWSYVDAILIELFLTFIFVMAILGVTDKKYHDGRNAGIVIGLVLSVVVMCGIKFTGTSVNPARSLGPAVFEAIFGNKDAIKQIWIFIVGPFGGAAFASVVYTLLA